MRTMLSLTLLWILAACESPAGDAKYVEVVEVTPPGQAAPAATAPAQPTSAAPVAASESAAANAPAPSKKQSFPLQVPADATVTDVSSVQRVGRKGAKGSIVQMSLQTKQTPAEIAAFYEQELKRKGLSSKKRSAKFGDGTALTLLAKKRRVRVKVVATQNRPSEPTEVVVTWKRG